MTSRTSRSPKSRSQQYREQIQVFLDEWAERGAGQPWQQFRNWSAQQVLWDYGLSMEEIEEAVVDGPRDKGIDVWYHDIASSPSKLVLIQSKDTAATRFDFSKMRDGFLDLIIPNRPQGSNDFLREKASQFSIQMPTTFELDLYVTTSAIASQDIAPDESGEPLYSDKVPIHDINVDTAHYIRDIKYLVENLQVIHNQPIRATFALHSDEFFMFDTGGGTRTIAAALPAVDLVQLFQQHRQNLFRKNPRYYLGASVRINDKLKKALLGDQREDFFIYNNGLTCVAETIRVSPQGSTNIVDLEDFQIVNGCQTTASIWSAKKARPSLNFSRIRVLAKIVENSRAPTQEDDMSNAIAERSNSQNPLRAEDWKANDQRQQRWQEQLSQRKPDPWFYEIKRGTWATQLNEEERRRYKDSVTGKFRKVSLKDLGQECWAFLGEPAAAKDRARQIFNEQKTYDEVFQPSLVAIQLLLPHAIFEEAKRWAAEHSSYQPENAPKVKPIPTIHLRFPCIYAVSKMLQKALGGAEGYRPVDQSELLIANRDAWLPRFVDIAMAHLGSALAAAVQSSGTGARAAVRRDDWMGQSITHACQRIADRLDAERELGGGNGPLTVALGLATPHAQ